MNHSQMHTLVEALGVSGLIWIVVKGAVNCSEKNEFLCMNRMYYILISIIIVCLAINVCTYVGYISNDA